MGVRGMSDCCGRLPERSGGDVDPSYRRVLWFAFGINAAMFVVEVVTSLLAGSAALQADALDFLGDAATYGVTLFVLGMALHWRARAALGKGIAMAAFGFWVIGVAAFNAVTGAVPRADLMSGIGAVALIANLAVAAMLFRFRAGDSNRLSVWLCSRNDAIANVAVIAAGAGVWLTSTTWPDVLVAALIAGLALSSAYRVILQAVAEARPCLPVAAE